MSIVADIQHTRMFPDALGSGLKRGATRAAGAALIVLATAGWLSLATWSNQDPSLSNATEGAVRNLLGLPGASVADLLFQTLGLAAVMLFLPMAAWGWHLSTLITPNHVAERLILWPLSLALFAGALAGLPATGGWPLPVGLGGLLGDHVLGAATLMGSFIGFGEAATRILAGLALPVVGFWGLSAAAGIKLSNYAVLWQKSEPRPGPVYDEEVIEYIAEPRPSDNPYQRFEARVPVVGHVDHMGRIEPVVCQPPTSVPLPRTEVAPAVLPPEIAAAAVEAVDAAEQPNWAIYQAAAQPVAAPAMQPQPAAESYAPALEPMAGEPVPFQAPVQHMRPIASQPAMPVFGYDPQTDRQRGRTKIIRGEQLPLLNLANDDGFPLPPLEFLRPSPQAYGSQEHNAELLQARADMLEQVLEDFKVKGEVIDIKPGPVVTLYEFEPARGIKSSQVIGLADDVARIMGATSARIAVIPGRNAIGIELPNEKRETVFLREQLEAIYAEEKKAKLPLVLGKNIAGESTIVDLAKMPHLLIAGTTGSGKSVGINTMILSLLYNLSPDQCKFIMIDPKMLELSVYDGIPHLLAPVVTDPKKAVIALNWTVKEMDDRYRKMSQIGVRNIAGYNQRIKEARMKGEVITRTVQTGFDQYSGQPIYEQEKLDYNELPFIVVVIDEMADLMMVAGKEIEGSVQRLAQKARAAGIHLITATQRPSVDVITGTIKANFPTRISFQVTSKIDSRTILGEMGAEQLLGAGDMLYMAGGGQITRVHGSFVADEEVERVANYLRAQGVPQYLDDVTRGEEEMDELPLSPREHAQDKFDDLYDEAVAVVIRDQKASTSYIQRRLGIGYNKAATLIERMQEEGVVSAPNNAGKRDILARRPDEFGDN